MNAFDPNFIGLTDDFEKVQPVLKSFGAFAEKEQVSDAGTDYLVSHTARLYLVSPDRKLLLMYPYGFEPEDLRSDLAHLLEQS
jgi:protein SCO1/2